MKMKRTIKYTALWLAFCVCFLYCPRIFAASPELYLTKQTESGEKKISSVEEGTITVHAEVRKKAVLIAALKNKTTGYLKEVSSDASDGAGHISTSIRVYDLQSNELTYYVWDSLTDRKTQKNAPPAAPKEVEAASKVNAIKLSWSKVVADEPIQEYRIYQGDTLLQKVSDGLEYTIRDLEENAAYTYAVSAVDQEGAESKKQTVRASTARWLQCRFDTEQTEEYGLNFTDNSTDMSADNYTKEAEMGGVCCRLAEPVIYNDKTKQGTLYFKVNLEKLPTTQNNVTFRIRYYDLGTGTMKLQYNAESSIAKAAPEVKMTDSKTWKTAVISVNDAKFTNPKELTYSGFRILAGNGEKLYVCSASVIASELYEAEANEPEQPKKSKISANLGTSAFDGLTLWLPPSGATSDGVTTEATIGGEACRYAPKGKWFYLTVDSNVIPSSHSKVKISLRYYDDNAGDITIQYNSGDTTLSEGIPRDYKSKTILQKTGSNTWKDCSFTLEDASFRHAQSTSYRADMRIGTQTNSDGLYVKQVEIEKCSE